MMLYYCFNGLCDELYYVDDNEIIGVLSKIKGYEVLDLESEKRLYRKELVKYYEKRAYINWCLSRENRYGIIDFKEEKQCNSR